MTHTRQTIRTAIVSALDTGAIVASGSVYSNRSLPIWQTELPIINVFMSGEDAELVEIASNRLSRDLPIVVEVVAQDTDDETIDNTLDGYAEDIEAAINADYTLGGACLDCQLTKTEIATDEDGDKRTGTLRLTYTVRYTTT